jgi:hypothetical protein
MKKHFGPALRVRYQVDWPNASDPMNKFAKADVQTRVTYYNVKSTPTTIFDGAAGSPSHLKIFNKQGYTSPIKIDIRTNPIADDNILSGSIVITASQARTGAHTLHIAVVERAIIYTKAPGSNGETEFYDILRRLITGNGQTIGDIRAGASSPYAFSWTVDVAKVKKEQVAVVAWVQDGSKVILNAATSIPTFFMNAQINEQSTNVKTGSTHYIKCSITNDNQTSVSTKITIRDSTKSAYTDTKLGWIAANASSTEPALVDSIVTSIDAGDSLIFWAVTTTPVTAGKKAVLELFAENRSDPQALGWGCVRYINLTTSESGKEYPKPTVTYVSPAARGEATRPSIMMRGNILAYSMPVNGHASITMQTLNGAIAVHLFSGMQGQGAHAIDCKHSDLKSGMYIVRCSFDGKVMSRIVAYVK